MMSAILSSLSSSSSGPKPNVSSRISLTSRWRSLRFSSGFSVSQRCSTIAADLVAQRLRVHLADPVHVEPVDQPHVDVPLERLVRLDRRVGLLGGLGLAARPGAGGGAAAERRGTPRARRARRRRFGGRSAGAVCRPARCRTGYLDRTGCVPDLAAWQSTPRWMHALGL